MKEILNSMPEILTWRTDLANCFYLVSEQNARTLAQLIRKRTGERGRFLVTEIDENRYGWLSNESWYLFRNKALKPTEKT
jgi:hypothetical protein